MPHMNCANIDCNELFIACAACKTRFNGCCCAECQDAPRLLRPVKPDGGHYGVFGNYMSANLSGDETASGMSPRRGGEGRVARRQRQRAKMAVRGGRCLAWLGLAASWRHLSVLLCCAFVMCFLSPLTTSGHSYVSSMSLEHANEMHCKHDRGGRDRSATGGCAHSTCSRKKYSFIIIFLLLDVQEKRQRQLEERASRKAMLRAATAAWEEAQVRRRRPAAAFVAIATVATAAAAAAAAAGWLLNMRWFADSAYAVRLAGCSHSVQAVLHMRQQRSPIKQLLALDRWTA